MALPHRKRAAHRRELARGREIVRISTLRAPLCTAKDSNASRASKSQNDVSGRHGMRSTARVNASNAQQPTCAQRVSVSVPPVCNCHEMREQRRMSAMPASPGIGVSRINLQTIATCHGAAAAVVLVGNGAAVPGCMLDGPTQTTERTHGNTITPVTGSNTWTLRVTCPRRRHGLARG